MVTHLDDYLSRLPEDDQPSAAILEQMRVDEDQHATIALRAGGTKLPGPVKTLMKLSSKLMTQTAFWI